MVLRAGKYILDDTGEKNAAKEPARSITLFCLAVNIEKVFGVGVDSGSAIFSISTDPRL